MPLGFVCVLGVPVCVCVCFFFWGGGVAKGDQRANHHPGPAKKRHAHFGTWEFGLWSKRNWSQWTVKRSRISRGDLFPQGAAFREGSGRALGG